MGAIDCHVFMHENDNNFMHIIIYQVDYSTPAFERESLPAR
jgi:hypothetical protein